MAPRGGSGGGRGFAGVGTGGSGAHGTGTFEQQTFASSMYGRSDSTPFTSEEILGSMVVNIIYGLILLICFFVIKDVAHPHRPATKKTRISWVRVLVWTVLFGVVGFGLEAARWGLLVVGGSKAGRSWRFGEAVGGLFMGVWEVVLVGVVFRLCGSVLAGLVPKSGPDPKLAKLRRCMDLASMAIWGLFTACVVTEIGLGYTLAKSSFDEWSTNGFWRLGDREFSTMMSEKGAQVETLANVYGDNVTPTEIWDSLVQRFIPADGEQDWATIRMAQLGLEYSKTCLVLMMLLSVGYIAFTKRSISNPEHTGSKGMIVRLSTTIIRGFLYIVLPTLLLSTLTRIITLSVLSLPNLRLLSRPSAWSSLRSHNPRFFDLTPTSADLAALSDPKVAEIGIRAQHDISGWLDGYRYSFENFQLFYAILKPLGWVALLVMLTLLSRKLVAIKMLEYDAEYAKMAAQREGMPYAKMGNQNGGKVKSNAMWRRFLRAL